MRAQRKGYVMRITPGQLRARRLRLGMSQRELAERALGYSSDSRIAQIEGGHKPMPRLMGLAMEAIENRHIAAGGMLYDDPRDYLLIKVGHPAKYYRWPPERLPPLEAEVVDRVHDDDGKLLPQYATLPVIFGLSYETHHEEHLRRAFGLSV